MRAVVCDRYGPPDVLRLEDVERPVPEQDEILVRIRATTVNRSDCGVRSGQPFIARFLTGLRRPREKILGSEFAGEVEAAGAAVTEFAVGDQVFGVNPWKLGAHAEFACMRESAALAHMPAGMSFIATDHLQNLILALWTSRVGDSKIIVRDHCIGSLYGYRGLTG